MGPVVKATVFAVLAVNLCVAVRKDSLLKLTAVDEPARSPDLAWQASLQILNSTNDRWEHKCSGTVIDQHWVITAAHCVDKRIVDGTLRVVVGVRNITGLEGMLCIRSLCLKNSENF